MQNLEGSAINSRIYLDHNATTPLSDKLKSRWGDLIEIFGNPSSIHFDGRQPKTILRETRQKLSLFLNCSPLEIIFNSGASEGNTTVIKSVFELLSKQRNEFLVSQIEHPSVIKAFKYIESHGARVHYIPVSRQGQIDLEFIEKKLSSKTALVSVMFANNETGVINPIKKISQMAHENGALMHSDCVQAIGKSNFNFTDLDVDYATFSAHKFYSLKGTGFCYVRKSSPWVPLIHGGGQERSRRGGTENIIGIAALNIVFDEVLSSQSKIKEMQFLRNLLEEKIKNEISDVQITAAESERVSNTSSLVIQGVDGETLLMTLDLKGFSVSTGAACSSGNPEPSPVLMAMGLKREEAQSSLRVSLGWKTSQKDILKFCDTLKETVLKLRSLNKLEEARNV